MNILPLYLEGDLGVMKFNRDISGFKNQFDGLMTGENWKYLHNILPFLYPEIKTYLQMHLDIILLRIDDENYNLEIILRYEWK